MTVLSCLRLPVTAGIRSALASSKNAPGSMCKAFRPSGAVRLMGGHAEAAKIQIKPSRFEWERFKDDLIFFMALGITPLVAVAAYTYLIIGPAELAEIPDGYAPHSWEYVQNPIPRWFQRNIYISYEQQYEKMCHTKAVHMKKRQNKKLEKKVRDLERSNQDFRGWYVTPPLTDSTDKSRGDYKAIRNKGGESE